MNERQVLVLTGAVAVVAWMATASGPGGPGGPALGLVVAAVTALIVAVTDQPAAADDELVHRPGGRGWRYLGAALIVFVAAVRAGAPPV
ncbi:MAG: hypothetical protein KDB21_14090, partial [Acidimicrobiales bacterium]|nr:hypothetical protein [Acidimicrobiales bacterium]